MGDLTLDKNNLIQLLDVSESKALKYMSYGIRGEWEFFVMNSKKNEFQLLTRGQLQQIQNGHSRKVIVYLEEFQLYISFNKIGNAAHSQKINFTDLWVDRINLERDDDDLMSSQREILMPGDKNYSSELDIANMVQRAITNKISNSENFKQLAKEYLETNFPDLSGTAIARITTLLNPDVASRGGRPKKYLK